MAAMKPITAGALRHKIIIQKIKTGINENGVAANEWEEVCTTMAAYTPISAKEALAAGTINAINAAIFQIRFRRVIDTTMRIVSAFGVFNINGVIDVDGRHRELQLQCVSEIQNGG